jgi:glycosyltransferase involved in cell wall biosynthesis
MNDAHPLAFVVQRYGVDIVGGSESLCRAVAEMQVAWRPVEVLTTCAQDYMTWRNHYPAGVSVLNGVTVRRFPVDFERDHRFHVAFRAILGGFTVADYPRQRALVRAAVGRSTPQQEREFLTLQGPYSTPLLDYLAAHHQEYALIVFFTYLYPATVFGSERVPAVKTVLAPTAHDEAPIFLPIFRSLFARFPAFIFLTPEERQFIEETFAVAGARKATIGMPVALAGTPEADRFRRKYGIDGPFLLYAGRIDSSKGCDQLVHFFQAARRHLPGNLSLIFIGNRVMDLPRDRAIRYLGMLPEQDKADAMAAATVFVQPSHFESFSIVILEAMLCGTPVLVNGHCEVMKGHVRRSQGGLYYEGYAEFVEALRWLLDHEALRSRMGQNGAEYVRRNYGPEVVAGRYRAFFDHLLVAASTWRGTAPAPLAGTT